MTAFRTEEDLHQIDRDIEDGIRDAVDWLRGNRKTPDESGVYERTDRDTIPAPPPNCDEESLDIDVVIDDVA
ncbi:hypothetical protein HS096_01985 [candidate division WWE3 bacterium]|uniref:Uncharacterized protein n=1 Tax=candidate division WWE3 bacterium TaxID=2053526 RepID=A0A928Y647_UNCKA|nr:hypothetical protein [candidate division WWE3 bacterium]